MKKGQLHYRGRPVGLSTALEDTTGEGYQEFKGAVC
jgi:hypothetical protein